MPQFTPIASESDVSSAIPKEDGEKRPTPNPGLYGGGSGPSHWPWSTFSSTQTAMLSELIVKDSQCPPAIGPSSPSFTGRR